MKNIIRKWLSIETPEAPEPISKTELRKMVGEAVMDALMDKPDFETLWGIPICRFKNTFTLAVSALAEKPAQAAAASVIKERIEAESFIDGVVERINRKQLR